MWVGAKFYPTIETFLAEARALGVCKRISRPPRGLRRVFLAHDEGVSGEGVIFAYAEICAIEIVCADGVRPPDGYTRVTFDQAGREPPRRCGRREDAGATYVVARTSGLHVIEPHVRYDAIVPHDGRRTRQRFRAWRRVDGDAILACEEHAPRPSQQLPDGVVERRWGVRWTDEERASLLAAVEERGGKSVQEVIRRWALAHGRTLEGARYQWEKLK